MKKIVSLLLSTAILVAFSISSYAINIGDIVGETLVTNIKASINEYDIASFNKDGYTVVVAEDLLNYGFNVEWNSYERALYITRNYSTNAVDSRYVAPNVFRSEIGKKAFNILHTDIKTYINGNYVTSYNIGGKTVVYMDDLSVFGDLTYNDKIRRIELTVNDGLDFRTAVEITNLVNQRRIENGLAPLVENKELSYVARVKAMDMNINGYFSHTSPTYGSPFEMMDSFGISYRFGGENIASGYGSSESVMTGWMNSPGHRANILNSSFKQIGIGYSADGREWVQMFIG